MPIEKIDINKLSELSKEELIEIIKILILNQKELEAKFIKDSSNSSKPPSTDGFKKVNK